MSETFTQHGDTAAQIIHLSLKNIKQVLQTTSFVAWMGALTPTEMCMDGTAACWEAEIVAWDVSGPELQHEDMHCIYRPTWVSP